MVDWWAIYDKDKPAPDAVQITNYAAPVKLQTMDWATEQADTIVNIAGRGPYLSANIANALRNLGTERDMITFRAAKFQAMLRHARNDIDEIVHSAYVDESSPTRFRNAMTSLHNLYKEIDRVLEDN